MVVVVKESCWRVLCLGYVYHSHVLTNNLCVQIGCPLAWYIESDNSRQMDAYELIYVD